MFLRNLSLLLFFVLTAPAYAQIKMQLKEFAEVQSRQIKLSDIAVVDSHIDGINQETLGNIVVAIMTHINQPLRIDAQHLEQLIARQQPGLRDKFQLIGASSVSVILPGVEFPLDEVMGAAKSFLRAELSKQPSPFEILEGKIERNSLLIPKGQLKLLPRFSSGSEPAKKMNVVVDIFVNNIRIDSIPVAIEINMTKAIYRLTRSATRGATLKKEDYALVEQPIDSRTRVASLLSPNTDISLLRLRQNMDANSVLYRENFELAPLVARHQKVFAELKSNGIVIENTVVAQADGRLGQLIKVADSDSSPIYFAKVIAQGRVEVK